MGRALVSPLSWGLGHATRDIPIIKEILRQGHEVTIASSGRSLALLKQEFPKCKSIVLDDYYAPYSKEGFKITEYMKSVPRMIRDLLAERRNVEKIVSKNKYDVIISDNRIGVHSKKVPSFLINHEVNFKIGNSFLESFTKPIWAMIDRKFENVIVPDNAPGKLSLTGELSYSDFGPIKKRLYYAGIIASVKKKKLKQDIDYLISISGPEPPRTMLEKTMLKQISALKGKKVVLLGKPGTKVKPSKDKNTTLMSHASRDKMSELINRAKFTISRSGYTTVMELAELGKNKGIFIPTPHHHEQEYLSELYMKNKWFYSNDQSELDLEQDIKKCKIYKGFPKMPKTEDNTKRLYETLLAQHLEK